MPETGSSLALPLVSVIIVNYNYAHFLDDALSSVVTQTYANIECIVVDDASSDGSSAAIAQLEERHPDLIAIRRETNGGQSASSLEGLAASSGQYVIFMDADDFLLPRCVETHVFVHLSMRRHVGLTSCDMLQVQGSRVVVAGGEEAGRYMVSKRGVRPDLVRPFDAIEGGFSARVATGIAGRVHLIAPLRVKWRWSPTSGICYRRDALALFADNARLATLRTGTDLYFAYGCSGLSGSVLIDEPLFVYRIHGGNIFTARAQLERTLNFTIGGSGDSNIKAQLYLVDHLVERAARFAPNLILKLNLCALIACVDRADVDPALPGWARRSRAAQAIARDWESFSVAVGPVPARLLLILRGLTLRSPRALKRQLAA